MIPGQPRQTRAVRAQARGRVEIVAAYKGLDSSLSRKRDANELIDRFKFRISMILTYTNQPFTLSVHHHVSVAQTGLGGNRLG